MIGKPILALASPFLLTSAQVEPRPEFDTEPMLAEVPGVAQVRCVEGSGTAFKTGSHAYTSANHVTSMTGCTVNGEALILNLANEALDYSSSRVPTASNYHPINCEGFKAGETYVAVGYARGTTPHQRATVVQKANFAVSVIYGWDDYTVLIGEGRFIPGQSGAPVFKGGTGEVVGIVKGFNHSKGISYARDLSTTPVCTGHVCC